MEYAKKTLKYISFCLCLGIIVLVVCMQVSITYAEPFNLNELLYLLKNPRIQAFLDTIAYAEGTFNSNGYNTQYTYKYFHNFNDHPREVICKEYKGNMLCSSAAGRYQFLKKTWDDIAPQISAQNFGPVNQDLGALVLLAKKDALSLIPKIHTKKDFNNAVYKVNETWASLPGAPYGQATRPMGDLENIFKKRVRYHKKHQADLKKKYQENNMIDIPLKTQAA